MKYFCAAVVMWMACFNATGKPCLPADTINICGHKVALPSDVTLTSPQHIAGPDFSLAWQYESEKQTENWAKRTLGTISHTAANFNETDLLCSLFSSQCKAYGITSTSPTPFPNQIILTAIVNNQPVCIQIMLARPGFTNEELPSFISRIITLSR